MRKYFNKKGVSLPELLAVVVVMGIMALITIPLVGSTIKKVEKKAYLGDLISVSEALSLYCNSEGDSEEPLSVCYEREFELDENNHIKEEYEVSTHPLVINGSSDHVLNKYLSKPLKDIAYNLNVIYDGTTFYMSSSAGGTIEYYIKGDKLIDPKAKGALDYISKIE